MEERNLLVPAWDIQRDLETFDPQILLDLMEQTRR